MWCPLPTSPSRFPAGILHPSSTSGQVDDPRIPSFCSSAPTVSPGEVRSTRNAENFSPSTFANTVNKSAIPQLVVHIFSPFKMYWLPSSESFARVRTFIASDPELDSDSEYAAIHSAVASFGR